MLGNINFLNNGQNHSSMTILVPVQFVCRCQCDGSHCYLVQHWRSKLNIKVWEWSEHHDCYTTSRLDKRKVQSNERTPMPNVHIELGGVKQQKTVRRRAWRGGSVGSTEDPGKARANIPDVSKERNHRDTSGYSRVLLEHIPGMQSIGRVVSS